MNLTKFEDGRISVPAGIDLTAPCWLWSSRLLRNGYGVLSVGRQTWLAHRFIWTLYRGEIPKRLTVDHLCRVKACVNPQHLEVVTQLENTRRGTSVIGLAWQTNHCIHGHPFSPENTRVNEKGHRYCRTCGRLWARKHYREVVGKGLWTWRRELLHG